MNGGQTRAVGFLVDVVEPKVVLGEHQVHGPRVFSSSKVAL
jgi:hypothetical protein